MAKARKKVQRCPADCDRSLYTVCVVKVQRCPADRDRSLYTICVVKVQRCPASVSLRKSSYPCVASYQSCLHLHLTPKVSLLRVIPPQVARYDIGETWHILSASMILAGASMILACIHDTGRHKREPKLLQLPSIRLLM